ncbi:MAG: translation initiation factor IF-3 [Candidatus Paceibacteria bacterium]
MPIAIRIKKKNRKPFVRKERIRINGGIRTPEVRVVDGDGENLGVMPTVEALKRAQEAELDLIEISPKAQPPIAKIADYGKFQYDQQKKASAAKQKAHATETKSLQVEVVTGENDLLRKARQAAEWLREGHRVKIELFLKGRYKYMEPAFLKERLNRFVLSVPEEYKVAEDMQKGPKGFFLIIERVGKKGVQKPKVSAPKGEATTAEAEKNKNENK